MLETMVVSNIVFVIVTGSHSNTSSNDSNISKISNTNEGREGAF